MINFDHSSSSRKPDDFDVYCKLEGLGKGDLLTVTNEEKSALDRDDVYKTLEFTRNAAEISSRLLDTLAVTSTDAAIFLLEHTIRPMDKQGQKVKPLPWEVLWLQRNNIGGDNIDLSQIKQQQAILDWLIDSIFPLAAIDEANSLRPSDHKGSGFRDVWLPHFLEVAREQKYAPARAFIEAAVDGTLTGLITALPAEHQTEAGILKLMGMMATASLGTRTSQKFNYLWGVQNALAIDLRQVVNRYGSASSMVKTNFDVAVKEVLSGSMAELNERLSVLSIWTMLSFMTLSSAVARFPERGAKSIVDAAVYAGLGVSVIRQVEKGKIRQILEIISGEFGALTAQINKYSENLQHKALMSQELVGGDKEVKRMASLRDLVTFLKNIPSGIVAESLPLVASTFGSLLVGDSFTSAAFSVGQVARQAVYKLGTFMTYKGSQASRLRSREAIIDDLRAIKQSVFGPLTDEALVNWQAPETINWNDLPHVIEIEQLGVPPFNRANDGSLVETFKFEPGFKLEKSKIYPVFGENGTGKTLLMTVLSGEVAGILEETQMKWGGSDIRQMNAELHRRMFKRISSVETDNLRSLLAKALIHEGDVRKNKLGFAIDKDKLLNWALGQADYAELEEAVSKILEDWKVKVHATLPWHLTILRPSGMQRAMANLAFHCLVDEPLNLLIDEAGGELDSRRIDDYIGLLRQLSKNDLLPGAVLVAVNKDVGKWMLTAETAYVDTRDEVQGHILDGGIGTEDLSDQLGADLVREYNAFFELGQPMSPDQFLIWLTHGPGKEFDLQAEAIKPNCYSRARAEGFDGFDHMEWIKKSGVMEFESGEYANYLKTCLTNWFEKFAQIEIEGGTDKKIKIKQHLKSIISALHAFYGRDRRVGKYRFYFRNLIGTVINNHNGRWNQELHEKVLANLLNTYLKPLLVDIGKAFSYKEEGRSAVYKNYPTDYFGKFNLLEDVLSIEELLEFFDAYYEDGNHDYENPPFGKIAEEMKKVSYLSVYARDVLRNLEPSKKNLFEKIVSDPIVLYKIAQRKTEESLKNTVEFFTLTINKLSKEDLLDLEAKLKAIRLPFYDKGVRTYRSFWTLVNEKEIINIGQGWLAKLVKQRLAALMV